MKKKFKTENQFDANAFKFYSLIEKHVIPVRECL